MKLCTVVSLLLVVSCKGESSQPAGQGGEKPAFLYWASDEFLDPDAIKGIYRQRKDPSSR